MIKYGTAPAEVSKTAQKEEPKKKPAPKPKEK